MTKRPISQELMTYFRDSGTCLAAALIAAIGGIPAGVASAVRRNSIVDHLVRVVSLFGVSMPIFWLSILALYVFYYKLGWVPSSQRIALTMSPPPPVTRLYLIDTLLAGDFKGFVSVVQHLFCLPSCWDSRSWACSRASPARACWRCWARTISARRVPRG